MAKLLSDYLDTVEMFHKMSYREKVSVCRESFLNILREIAEEDIARAATVAIMVMGSILGCDSCISEQEKQFLKDVTKMSMITDEYIEKHMVDFRSNSVVGAIRYLFETISREIKREYVTIAIGMITVDGKDDYREKAKLKDFFDFYEVFAILLLII